MKRWLVKCALMALCGGLPGVASAQNNCANFTDYPASASFCANVEWVKNRGITTGCTSTTYCPDSGVTRLQMAIFMNRLGRALSTEVLSNQVVDDGGGAGLTLPGDAGPALVRCVTAETAAVGYPRTAVATGVFTALSDGNNAGFRPFLLIAANGGNFANFDTDPVGGTSIAQRATATATTYGSTTVTEQVALQPNTSYRFAIGVRRDNNASLVTTGNFEEVRCQITVTVHNRNGTSSPFDPAE